MIQKRLSALRLFVFFQSALRRKRADLTSTMQHSMLVLSLFIVACTSAPPALQAGPDAERTFDGLVRVDNSRFRNAWADPEIDFSQYKKVMPGGARFEFRAVSKTARRALSSSRKREFWISDANRNKLVDTVSGVFNEEFSKVQGWEAAEEAGPDVLSFVARCSISFPSSHPKRGAATKTTYLQSGRPRSSWKASIR